MSIEDRPHPPVVTRDQWLAERKKLLAQEKELTKFSDRVNAMRRRLPMVRVDKPYVFDSPQGQQSLADLFAGRQQLIVYHFMFDPQWEQGCSGCTELVDAIGDLSMLPNRDTSLVLVSRAPLEKLERYRAVRGWTLPWVSSFGSDFNFDFHVSLDPQVAPPLFNYRSDAEFAARFGLPGKPGERQGVSVFFRRGEEIFHTYSSYARGTEAITDSYRLLDLTPYGRQEDFEDSPAGWPQRPTYG